ncbi:MAG: DNA-binding response regulator [Candidatus Omnitrophica bacterium]|nr:DNA-binding response regulator [Candidatus Omnitrophota bacterium]
MAEKVLIVDDDREFREELKEALEEYQVLDASSGVEALGMLKRANEIGVVILDVMMPGLSGTDVLREIKKRDPELGIVILTGHGSKDVAVEALRGNADDFVEKPVDIENFKEIIEKLLEKRRRGEDGIDISDINGKIEKIKDFAERNCYKKIGLKEAAEAVCLSPKYLSRIFKQKTGKSFSEYRLKIKIEKARELLSKSANNVNQIADKLGYENVESFIRQFKKLTRKTPTEYRKKNRK